MHCSRKRLNRAPQRPCVERLKWTRRQECWVYRDIISNADDEQPRSGLRNEEISIDHQSAAAIADLCESSADRFEILAAVRGQCTTDVFQRDDRRSSFLGLQRSDHVPKRIEGAGPFPFEACANTRQRQILARE